MRAWLNEMGTNDVHVIATPLFRGRHHMQNTLQGVNDHENFSYRTFSRHAGFL
jgi:hypothetical protein